MNFKRMLMGAIVIFAGLVGFVATPVFADDGPVIVQAFVQQGREAEISVNLVSADTEEVVARYKLNNKNKWIQKGTVPVGKYKMRVYIDGLKPRATTKVKATLAEKEVVANPKQAGEVDKTPRFVAVEGDEDFMSKYYGFVDFAKADGSMIKGVVTDKIMKKHEQDAVAMQQNGGGAKEESKVQDVAGPDFNTSSDNKTDSEYVPEKEDKKEPASDFDSEGVDKKPTWIKPAIYGGLIGFVGSVTYFVVKRRKK